MTATSAGSRFGDAMITVAGAHREELEVGSADRSYYIGMGMALLLAATISSVSLAEASSIAFHVKINSPPIIFAALVYFVLLLGVDRWLVSDQTTGFVSEARGGLAVSAAWFRHFLVELLKIAPRFLIALLSSWLFANFLLLAVFNPEIQKQLKAEQVQEQAQYQLQVDAQAQQVIGQAQAVINKAKNAEGELQTAFDNDQGYIAAAQKQEQKALKQATADGLKCTEQAQYTTTTNSAGKQVTIFTGFADVCPPEIESIYNAYNATLTKYPETQAQVNAAENKIANQYHVAKQERVIADAHATAAAQLQQYQPKKIDGLLARMHALGLLTTKPARACPLNPTAADLANNVACTSQYSADAATMHTALRLWLLGFEILPIVLKFVNALLPRRGYAWAMAARDAQVRRDARVKIGQAQIEETNQLARIARAEHIKTQEAGALEEYQLRELARQEGRLGIRRIRAKVTGALAAGPATRRLERGPDGALEGAVLAPGEYAAVEGADVSPGRRVIDSEDFLL